MCGIEYDPEGHMACEACPLNRDCQITCCPVCGYQNIDPSGSRLAQLASRFLFKEHGDIGQPQNREGKGGTG
jgi:hypothetical protein